MWESDQVNKEWLVEFLKTDMDRLDTPMRNVQTKFQMFFENIFPGGVLSFANYYNPQSIKERWMLLDFMGRVISYTNLCKDGELYGQTYCDALHGIERAVCDSWNENYNIDRIKDYITFDQLICTPNEPIFFFSETQTASDI